MESLPATLGFVAALAAVTAWALWLNLSSSARERIFGPRIDRAPSFEPEKIMALSDLAAALGLKPTGFRSQWQGRLEGIVVVLSCPEPGLLALRESTGRLGALSARSSVIRRMGRSSKRDPIQNLGDEAAVVAFVRGSGRDRVLRWMADHGLTIESGELRINASPGGDEVTRLESLAKLLAELCRTPNVLAGLASAVREEPQPERRLRALELLLSRAHGEPIAAETCRGSLEDADPAIAILAGLFLDDVRDRILRDTSSDALASAVQRFSRDTRPSAVARIGESGEPAAAMAVAQALLCGGWIEDDALALQMATFVLGRHGTPEALVALARERDMSDGLRRDALSSSMMAIRRRFPDADTSGQLSIAKPVDGALSVTTAAGALSLSRKQKSLAKD